MAIPDASSPTNPQVLTLFQEELARSGALPGLAAAGPSLWPRFVGYYQGLAHLPRKARRSLQRRWRRSLGGIALLCALGQTPALAATIFVDSKTCTLVDAITAANSDAPVGGCTAGSGKDTVIASGYIPLATVNNNAYGPTGLPVISSEITISSGNVFNNRIERADAAPEFRILAVGAIGNLTLQNTNVSGGVTSGRGGGIYNRGTLNLTRSSSFSNKAYYGGGIDNNGTLTLTNSVVASNMAASDGGGVFSRGTLTLTGSDVFGNTAQLDAGGIFIGLGSSVTLADSAVSGNSSGANGGGIFNLGGTLTLTRSTVEDNSAKGGGGGGRKGRGGGVYNRPSFDFEGTHYASILILNNSTVSGNTAYTSGGGVSNGDTLTLTNSTVSGNTTSDRGGGVESTGTVTFTNSTVTGNACGRVAGGLFNTGTVTLIQSLVSGNTAPVNGPEVYSVADQSGGGTVNTNGFNVVGHDGSPGIAGFTLGASDVVPPDPLAAILDPTLAYNGGPTRTHALVFGSPAVDAVPGTACVTATDQRGAPRAQDGDGDSFNDCDSGAVERGQVPVQASLNSTRLDCRTAACQVPVTCNLTEAQCTNEVELTVPARPPPKQRRHGREGRKDDPVRRRCLQHPARRHRDRQLEAHQAGQATRAGD